MTVRMKMRCDAVEKNDEGCGTVRLYPVIGNSPENAEFFRWTPSGQLVMSTVNANAVSKFTVGEEYYVDISPAAVPEVVDPPVDHQSLVPGPQEPFTAAPLTPLDGTENGQLSETPPETPSGL
jgi:hypothetical protein